MIDNADERCEKETKKKRAEKPTEIQTNFISPMSRGSAALPLSSETGNAIQ